MPVVSRFSCERNKEGADQSARTTTTSLDFRLINNVDAIFIGHACGGTVAGLRRTDTERRRESLKIAKIGRWRSPNDPRYCRFVLSGFLFARAKVTGLINDATSRTSGIPVREESFVCVRREENRLLLPILARLGCSSGASPYGKINALNSICSPMLINAALFRLDASFYGVAVDNRKVPSRVTIP